MTLDDLIARHEQQLAALRAWQDQALSRWDRSLGQPVGQASQEEAPDTPRQDTHALDEAARRHAAMAQQVLASTAAYERRVLAAVRDDPRSQPQRLPPSLGATAGPGAAPQAPDGNPGGTS